MVNPANELVTFLLVEDDDAHAKLTIRTFQKSNIDNPVVRVHDGDEALLYLRRKGQFEGAKRPGVIFLDLNIPGTNGLDVLKTIKEDQSLRTIPIVILTTSRSLSDRQTAYMRYANSYIVKPVDCDKFFKMAKDIGLYWGQLNTPSEEV